MSEITLHTQSDQAVTILQNRFIDEYMPRANGEYVKIYLYLQRLAAAGAAISISRIAETFEHTENDIRRALTYWEKEGLLKLSFTPDKKLASICLMALPPAEEPAPVPAETPAVSREETAAAREIPPKTALTADRVAKLKNQEDIEQLLFIAAQYLGRILNPGEISNLLYFYDTLHFSAELIEYLIEYCVSKGSKSTRYMEKVALEWAKEGIATVQEAKASTNLYNKNYYTILNAFGIKGRGPAKPEIEFMNQWLNTYQFTMDIIAEACSRTISQTQRPNFQYANKILAEWHKNNVRHLADIEVLDAAHQKNKKTPETKRKQPAATNKFNNFQQRDYDYESLEKQLLNS